VYRVVWSREQGTRVLESLGVDFVPSYSCFQSTSQNNRREFSKLMIIVCCENDPV
jgi:hypothetical protein